jgi:hypothetical protein
MMRILPSLMALTLLAACGTANDDPSATTSAQNNQAAAAFVPPKTLPPTPVAGQAHAVPLTAYIGHYPRDAVDGVSFFDRTEVATALVAAVGDADLRHMMTGNTGVSVPIFAYRDRIGAHGCTPHDCAARNWTFLITPDGGSGTGCYHDAATMGDTSRWYDNDKPAVRPGDCPQV